MPIGQKYSVNEEEKREGESQEGQELDEKDRERENEEAKRDGMGSIGHL